MIGRTKNEFSGVSRTQMMDVYRFLLRAHGPNSPKALGWSDAESQSARFRTLVRDVAPGSRLIDFGCGLGDLCGYLQSIGLRVQYRGVDILPETVRIARRKHPQGRFSVRGSLKGLPSKSADHIVASGVFNYRLLNHLNYLMQTLAEFVRVAAKGFALDLLSLEAIRRPDEQYFAIDRATLEEILSGMQYEIDTSPLLKSHFVFVRLK